MRNNKIFRYNGQVPGYCLTFQVLLLKFDEIFEIHTATLYNHSCQQYLVWLIGDILHRTKYDGLAGRDGGSSKRSHCEVRKNLRRQTVDKMCYELL